MSRKDKPKCNYQDPVVQIPVTPISSYVRLGNMAEAAITIKDPKASCGAAKPSMFGTPPVALFQLGGVMALGTNKYGLFNWRKSRITASTYYDAAQRHLMAWRDGENIDLESEHHPLAHVMACCAIIIDAETHGVLDDDRGTTMGMTSEYIAARTKV